ncbi:MAG: ATP-grasp domain-containing protein [Gammaproteobacteria bacterium]|nr:ATP-grasp domain-containing protein [Gammaproteobacteria bacterium]
MTTALLTLGRLPKALEVARALHGVGVRVLVAEPFERHLSGVSKAVAQSFRVTTPAVDGQRYLDDLQALVVAHQVDLLVPISEEIVHVSALHGALPASCRLLSMSQAEILAVHDKRRFIETCAAAGVSAPQSYPSEHAGARELAAQFDYVLKPTSSCSGRGVRFFNAGDPVPAVTERSIVQRLLRGELVSSFSIARAGEVRLTVLYRGAVMQGTVAVCFERIDAPPAVDQWIRRFVAHTQFDGFISFDLMIDAEGQVHGIECNPRATSGIHFVEPRSLAAALLEPQTAPPPALRTARFAQQFYPCLTETQKSMFTRQFRRNLQCLLQAREVTWEAKDPWPFIVMPYTAWNIIALAASKRMTFGEVAMLDFAWSADKHCRVAGASAEVVE